MVGRRLASFWDIQSGSFGAIGSAMRRKVFTLPCVRQENRFVTIIVGDQ
jgi:hypothetical protein